MTKFHPLPHVQSYTKMCHNHFPGNNIPSLSNNPKKQIYPGWLGWPRKKNIPLVNSCWCHDGLIFTLENVNKTPPFCCLLHFVRPPISNPSVSNLIVWICFSSLLSILSPSSFHPPVWDSTHSQGQTTRCILILASVSSLRPSLATISGSCAPWGL